MSEIHHLSNDHLRISVDQTGAELCSIINLKNNIEYMWEADPTIWKGHAPILFPIVGALKDGKYIMDGKTYELPQHGFVRKNSKWILSDKSEQSLSFLIASDKDSIHYYPFKFNFYTTYTLVENAVVINHRVENKDGETMYFSIGAHPAFKCPLIEGEQYSDYFIELEHHETANTYQIENSGLIGKKSELIFDNSKTLQLQYNTFNKGALVFKNLKSRKAKLVSSISGDILELSYPDFPYLGLWAKPKADFVCIEPWKGIADSTITKQMLRDKEGILKLEPATNFETEYSIKLF